jgi:N-acetylglucosamine kinase-like BadF-type ATPase
MILIADGGSTKTDWRLLKEGREFKQIQTTGFNPYLVGSDEIESILWKELQPYIDNNGVSKIYYYGAGCSTATKNQTVEVALEKVFPAARISIDHDLLGAARALCGNQPGIAAILGTGSNSCYYNGSIITDNIFSLGYFFGDEGSGAFMGKNLISAFLHNELPPVLAKTLVDEFPMSKESILDAVYNKPAPSRFLASFSTFILAHKDDLFIRDLIMNNFRSFYKYQVACYPHHKEVPVNFVGSVAYHYQQFLHEVGTEFEASVGRIIRAPIDGLVEYHMSEIG